MIFSAARTLLTLATQAFDVYGLLFRPPRYFFEPRTDDAYDLEEIARGVADQGEALREIRNLLRDNRCVANEIDTLVELTEELGLYDNDPIADCEVPADDDDERFPCIVWGCPEDGHNVDCPHWNAKSVFRPGGQSYETGPRPKLSVPRPRCSDSDRLDQLIALVEDVRNLLEHNPSHSEASFPVPQPTGDGSARIPGYPELNRLNAVELTYDELDDAARATRAFARGTPSEESWDRLADKLVGAAERLYSKISSSEGEAPGCGPSVGEGPASGGAHPSDAGQPAEVTEYEAIVTRSDPGWSIYVPEVDRHTYAAHVREIESMARDLVQVMTDLPLEDITVAPECPSAGGVCYLSRPGWSCCRSGRTFFNRK